MINLLILIILLLFHVYILIHLQFTAWPEMLSYSYLNLHGYQLYKDFAHPYTPLLTLLLSLVYSLFGLTVQSLQIFTWIWIIISDLLVFKISRLLLGNRIVTFIPVALYIFLQPILEGNMLWLDLGIIPAFLLGLYFALRWIKKNQKKDLIFWGLSWSLALFIKQQAGLLFIAAILFIFCFKKLKVFSSVSFLILGSMVPAILVLLWSLFNGIFANFIFWTLEFPILWLPKIPDYSELPSIRELVIPTLIFLPGLLLSLLNKKKETIFLSLVCLTCITMSFPRFSYFHLQPALSVYVLLLTFNILNLLKKYKFIKLLIFLPILGGLLLARHTYPVAWNQPPRFYEQRELDMAQKISEIVKPENKVYLLGPYSSLYTFANRLPPKPWYDNFVWYFEIPGIQEKQISGLQKDRPDFILWQIPKPGLWYKLGTYQPKKIVEYIKLNYNLEGMFTEGVELWKRKD